MSDVFAEIMKVPPVTRFLVGSSLAVTVPTLLHLVSPYPYYFAYDLVRYKYELWRIFTSFFIAKGGIFYLVEVVMLFRTSLELETVAYQNRSADYAWQTFLAAGGLLVATLPVKSFLLSHPFYIYLATLSAKLAPAGAQTSLMGVVTVPVVWMPWVFVVIDLIMGGPREAAAAVAAVAVGHLSWWAFWGGNLGSEGRYASLGKAPEWLKNLLGDRSSGRPPQSGGTAAGLARSGIHVTAPPSRRGPSENLTGHQWGSGKKLGTS